MRKLKIEWRHFEEDGTTCDRCFDTGRNIHKTIRRLQKDCEPVKIDFREDLLTEDRLPESNRVFLNGISLEDLIPGSQVSESRCESCSLLAGRPVSCRCVEYAGHYYDAIPPRLIYQAACNLLNCCNS